MMLRSCPPPRSRRSVAGLSAAPPTSSPATQLHGISAVTGLKTLDGLLFPCLISPHHTPLHPSAQAPPRPAAVVNWGQHTTLWRWSDVAAEAEVIKAAATSLHQWDPPRLTLPAPPAGTAVARSAIAAQLVRERPYRAHSGFHTLPTCITEIVETWGATPSSAGLS